MYPIQFRIDATPVPQPRQRYRIQKGGPQGDFVRPYQDPKHPVHTWKVNVLDAWRLVMPSPGFRFEGPICVLAEFVMPRPKSMNWKTKPTPRIPDQRQTSGDLDNLLKSTLDALNSKAWNDDRQIVSLLATKWIAAGGEEPHATLIISEFNTPETWRVVASTETVHSTGKETNADLR